jgi:hypothetical protein
VPIDDDPVDVAAEVSELERRFQELNLEKPENFSKDLKEADEHYTNGMFGACIQSYRNAFEVAMMGVARAYAKAKGKSLSRTALAGPVRTFLHTNGIITEEEREMYFALYTILSVQGGHSNMSQRHHARICRQYALTATHSILLIWTDMVEKMKP